MVLDVRHLTVHFDTYAGQVEAVRDISFELHEGETLALVGESGCGKSVTCRSIMGLLARNARVAEGEILFEGQDLLKLSNRAMREIRGGKIAMIFQDPMTSLDPTMKVGKQVAEAVRLHRKVTKGEAKKRAIELLDLVGIENAEKRYDSFPHEFSGGQRQRIVIAIALACDPKILIADEPTTALDVTMQAQILDLMKDIQKRTGASVIFITHDLGVVANVADRVAVMYAGRIIEIGQADEVFYDPRHPYTWGLLASMPTLHTDDELLYAIPGTPPTLISPPPGDAFAPRNPYALEADRLMDPPLFEVTPTHFAATWLLDPRAPKMDPPENILKRRTEYQVRLSERSAAL
ncbi:MAG: ABC transporter ATP-binding protein [Clostridia bacterium]|nr:ABC transporter ATP-binding protein [Clostridia bacterium]